MKIHRDIITLTDKDLAKLKRIQKDQQILEWLENENHPNWNGPSLACRNLLMDAFVNSVFSDEFKRYLLEPSIRLLKNRRKRLIKQLRHPTPNEA